MEPDILDRIRKAVSELNDERRPAEVVTLGRAEHAALREAVAELGFSADTPLAGSLYGLRINLVDEPTRLTFEAEADHEN